VLVLLDAASHGLATGTETGPFLRDVGEAQGRIQNVEGDWVYELGHATLEDGAFSLGDHHEVTQTIGTPDAQASLVRVDVDVVTPASLPSGFAWEFSARLNGAVLYARKLLGTSRFISLRDVALSLANSAPPDVVAFRLEVVVA